MSTVFMYLSKLTKAANIKRLLLLNIDYVAAYLWHLANFSAHDRQLTTIILQYAFDKMNAMQVYFMPQHLSAELCLILYLYTKYITTCISKAYSF